MKKHLLFVLFFYIVATSFCRAQSLNLYGLTTRGGQGNVGSIFQTNATGSVFKTDFSFYNQGIDPLDNVIEATNGLFYGVTNEGGGNDDGIIFSYNSTTGVETDLYEFGDRTDGKEPAGALIQVNDSLLYGLTVWGGIYDSGTIFSYNINTGAETDVYDFNNTTFFDGTTPAGALTLASNGLLYGTTSTGGANACGTIFSYSISTGTETDLYDFQGWWYDGQEPFGTLIEVGDTALYGVTGLGGLDTTGVIFNYNISTGKEKVLYNFPGPYNYVHSPDFLTLVNDSLLYSVNDDGGTTYHGNIFSYNILSGVETDVYDFGNGTDGAYPSTTLLPATNGLLYGATYYGGVNNAGTIFSYNPATGIETDVYDVSSGTYFSPDGAFIQAANGLLYGTAFAYGANNGGSLFTYNITLGSITNLYNFSYGTTGSFPLDKFTRASNGLCYGITEIDGNNNGLIYSYDITTGVQTDLHDFVYGGADSDGIEPVGYPIQAGNGLLYGETFNGGTHNKGTLYSYNIATGKESVVYNFNKTVNGEYPNGSLLQANNGLLYGVANGGTYDTLNDADGDGVLFSFDISTGTETMLYDFGAGGKSPNGPLIQASNGLLYGLAYEGGTYQKQGLSGGTIFSYDIATNTETDVYDFGKDSDGVLPHAGLIQATNGLLYGTASLGGTDDTIRYGDGGGILFSFNTANDSETVLHNFGYGTDGWWPTVSLIQASNGLLYGCTLMGGAKDSGMIFSYNISNSTYSDIHDFGNLDGGAATALVEIDSVVSPVWPGDANDDLIVNNYDLLPIGIYYGVTGHPRDTVTNTWAPHPALDWDSLQFNGYNLKFADCNGDSTINSDDTLAITLNYGDTHLYHSPRGSSEERAGGAPLYFINDSSSYHPGSRVDVAVWLGNSTTQAAGIYGLGYDIAIDTSLIQPGTLAFNYNNSFLGTKNTNALSLIHIGSDVETAIVGTDHVNKNGYGKIGDLYFTLNSSTTNPQLLLSVSSSQAVDSAGNVLTIQPINDTLNVITTGINRLSVNTNQLFIYPNPSTGEININSTKTIDDLKVTNLLGQLVYESQPKQMQFAFELKDDGMYFVTVTSGNETTTSKVVVNK